MIQTPLPPEIPFDPNEIVRQIVPLVGMLIGLVGTGFIALGPIGRAIGDVIRHLFGARKAGTLAPGEMDEVLGRLDSIQGQLGELAERQDFADRMLAQVRRDRQLPGSGDVAG